MLLNNQGIKTESPIWYHYDWPCNFEHPEDKPMVHQKMTSAFMTHYPMCNILNAMGTGKTLAALWGMDFLMRQNMVHSCLIVTPLSTLDTVWANTLYQHMPHRSFEVLHGEKKRRTKRLSKSADFYITNHDGLKVLLPLLISGFITNIHAIILDEAAVLRNLRTVYKAFKEYVESQDIKWRYLLTGTPTPNEVTDAYPLGQMINNKFLSHYGYDARSYKGRVMYRVTDTRWEPQIDALQVVSQTLQPAIRFKREDCVDLPEESFIDHKVGMSSQQEDAYEQMIEELMIEYENGEIVASNEIVKLNKLLQIACGLVINTETGEVVTLNPRPKFNALKEIISEADNRMVVYTPYKESLAMIHKVLSTKWRCVSVSGKTTPKQRNEIFTAFQNSDTYQVMIANPKVAAHGQTFTASHTGTWWGATIFPEIYEQASGRFNRLGQTQKTTIINMYCANREREAYSRLKHKRRLQGTLLDILTTGQRL